ncbi:MAG: hypothetical protein LBH43_17385, partial [Treponema sp.]|nr:hypothetical protein [Treponema sp.]
MKERNSYGSNSFIRVFLGLSVLTLLFMGCPESDSDDSNGDPTAPTHEEKIAAFVAEHGTILNKNNTTVTGTDYAAVEAALAALDEAFPGSTSSDVAGYKTQLSGLKTTINEINAAAGKIDMFNTAIDDAASDAEVEAALIALLGDEALLPEGNGLANKERYLALSSINYSNGKTSLTKGALDAIVPQLEAGIQVIVKLEEGIKKLTPHDKIPVAVDAANIVAYYKALLDVSISGTEYYGITVTAAGTWTVTLSLNSYKAVSGSLSLTAIASLSGDLWFGADNADVFKDKTTLTQADVDIIMKLEPDHLKLAHNVTAIKGKVEISPELFNGTVLQPTLQPTFAIPGGRSIMLTGGSSLHFLGGPAGVRGHSVLFSGDGEYKNTSGEEILVERYIDASKLHFKLKIRNDSDPDK